MTNRAGGSSTFVQTSPSVRFERGAGLILPLIVLSLTAAARGQETVPTGQAAPVVGVAASFPKSSNKDFVAKLQKFAAASAAAPQPLIEYCCTYGDPNAAGRLRSLFKGEKPRLLVYLDAASLRLVGPSIPSPSLTVVSSRSAVKGAETRTSWVLETTPDAKTVARMLRDLRPVPASLGLVGIEGDAGHEVFFKEFRQAFAGETKADAPRFVECLLPAAPCNNSTAVSSYIEQKLASLPGKSLLLILPGNNTQKYPFVFEQYAASRNLGMVGLGEFHGSGELLHIGSTADELARACLEILDRTAGPMSPGEPEIVPLAYSSSADSARLKALGYETGSSLPAPPVGVKEP